MSKIPQNKIRQLFLLGIILFLIVLVSTELVPYLGGVLGAVALYVLLIKYQQQLEKKGWKSYWAASLLIAISVIVILIPVTLVSIMFSTKISTAIENSDQVIKAIKSQLMTVEDYTGLNLAEQINTGAISSWASSSLQSLASSGLTIFISLGIMLFLLYYLLTEYKVWHQAAIDYLPIAPDKVEVIGKESIELVKSNAIAIPLVALLQGLVALIGFWIFGVENAFFWFVITTIGSMIPFVGTAIGVIPVSLLLISQGDMYSGIGILIYGLVVVGSTDNLFRLVVQKKLADIHPLITLIGVVVGVPLFGFIGLIFGPLLISLTLLLIKIYKSEYGENGEQL